MVSSYENDPLVHDKISAALFVNGYQTGLNCIEEANKIAVPIILIHGADDNIISVDGSREFTDNAGEKVTLKIWEETKHEPHNDVKKEEVIQYVKDWLKGQLN